MPEWFTEDLAEVIARAIHQAYVNNCAAHGDSPLVNSSMRPWEDLPEDLRRSLLGQAASVGNWLDAIDCVIIPESGALPEFTFTDAEIDLLAEMEHRRWVDERKGPGIVARRQPAHPDLVSWQYLSANAQDKDRGAVRVLRALLGHGGFQILRLPPAI